MTDAQTLIFMKSLRQRVEDAFEKAESLMPKDAPKEPSFRLYRVDVSRPLASFDELLKSLDEDIDLLTKSVNQPAA